MTAVQPRREVYTSGQLAKILLVAPKTVAKFIDAGLLQGHRLPGRSDRRVYHADLLAFLDGTGMRTARGFHDGILCVGPASLASGLATRLPGRNVAPAADWFAAGGRLGSRLWEVVVIDHALGHTEASRVASEALRSRRTLAVAAVATEEMEAPDGVPHTRHPLTETKLDLFAAALGGLLDGMAK